MPFPLKINATTLPALIFGFVLVLVAIGLAISVWRNRRALDSIVESDELAELHANRQFRRRMQVSVMLGIIGLLIALGDQLDQLFSQRPLYFLFWVGSIILLTLWMVLMALGDWLSTMTYSEIAKARLRFERRELEAQIRHYHASANGQSPGVSEETE